MEVTMNSPATHHPLMKPPLELIRIANAVGIKEGDTFTLGDVAELVESMAMDLAESLTSKECEACRAQHDATIARLRKIGIGLGEVPEELHAMGAMLCANCGGAVRFGKEHMLHTREWGCR